MRKRKKPLPPLPADFTNIRALPIPVFAACSEQHEETVRRHIANGRLRVIEISPNKKLVVLSDEHRTAFSNHIVVYRGVSMTLAQAAHRHRLPGLSYRIVRKRVGRGWDIERALNTPARN